MFVVVAVLLKRATVHWRKENKQIFQRPLDAVSKHINLGELTVDVVRRGVYGDQVINRIEKQLVAVVQSLSHVQLFATSWTAACQASLSFTISQSLHKSTSIESVHFHFIFFKK